MRRWYVVQTKPAQELLAARELRNQTFEVYLPKKTRRETIGGRVKPVTSLRFEGYLFVTFDPALSEHGPIGNTRGVQELLCARDGSPKPLPAGVVEALRQIEDEEFEESSRRVRRGRVDLKPGDEVVIDRHGSCQGLRGQLVASLRGVATILCGLILVTLPDCDISRAPEEAKTKARA